MQPVNEEVARELAMALRDANHETAVRAVALWMLAEDIPANVLANECSTLNVLITADQ